MIFIINYFIFIYFNNKTSDWLSCNFHSMEHGNFKQPIRNVPNILICEIKLVFHYFLFQFCYKRHGLQFAMFNWLIGAPL